MNDDFDALSCREESSTAASARHAVRLPKVTGVVECVFAIAFAAVRGLTYEASDRVNCTGKQPDQLSDACFTSAI